MLPISCRRALRHRDRWRVADMLREQPDLSRRDAGRDMDLWRHLFAADDIVRVGHICHAACEAKAAEWCWGNTWTGAVVQRTVVLCWPASESKKSRCLVRNRPASHLLVQKSSIGDLRDRTRELG